MKKSDKSIIITLFIFDILIGISTGMISAMSVGYCVAGHIFENRGK